MNRRKTDTNLPVIAGLIAAIVTIILAYGFIGAMDYQDEQRAHETYCDMVFEHKRSGGEYGWPDFKNQWENC